MKSSKWWLGVVLVLLGAACWVFGQVTAPPPAASGYSVQSLFLQPDANSWRTALGFNPTNFTAVTNYAGNGINISNHLTAKFVAGTGLQSATNNAGQPTEGITVSVANVPFSAITQGGNIITQNFGGTVTATAFAGDGSALTGVGVNVAIAKTDGKGTNTTFYDSLGAIAANVGSRFLYDGSGHQMLDWGSGATADTSSNPSVDWENRILWDSTGLNQSLDWGNRQLLNPSGAEVMDWISSRLVGNWIVVGTLQGTFSGSAAGLSGYQNIPGSAVLINPGTNMSASIDGNTVNLNCTLLSLADIPGMATFIDDNKNVIISNSVTHAAIVADTNMNNSVGAIVRLNNPVPNSTSSGIQEALYTLTNYISQSGVGTLQLGAGIFDFSTISFPSVSNRDLMIRIVGAGKGSTFLRCTNTTTGDFISCGFTGGASGNSGEKDRVLSVDISDLCLTSLYDTNKATLLHLSNMHEIHIHDCAIRPWNSFYGSNNVFSANLVDGVPTNKVGLIGINVDGVSLNNLCLIENCFFEGLAVGVRVSTDHSRIRDCFFGGCGRYFSTSHAAPALNGTAYTVIGTNSVGAIGNPVNLNNMYSVGCGILADGCLYECMVEDCEWYTVNAPIINNLTPFLRVVGYHQFERANMSLLTTYGTSSGTETNGPSAQTIVWDCPEVTAGSDISTSPYGMLSQTNGVITDCADATIWSAFRFRENAAPGLLLSVVAEPAALAGSVFGIGNAPGLEALMVNGNLSIGADPSSGTNAVSSAFSRLLADGSATFASGGATISAAGIVNSSAGYKSTKNNGAAPTGITVGASVFNYTNTTAVNIQVFLDANGATTAVTFNGTAIFASLASGDHTIIMQPGDRIAVTYSVATPVMKYREF